MDQQEGICIIEIISYCCRKRWIVDIEEDMQIMGMRQWRKQCKERAEWKRITEKAETHSGL